MCSLTPLAHYASRTRVRFIFTAQKFLARIQVLNKDGQLAPGDTGFVQLRLEAPVVAVAGERFIVRSYSLLTNCGRRLILDPFAAKHRGRDLSRVRELLQLVVANSADRVSLFVLLGP